MSTVRPRSETEDRLPAPERKTRRGRLLWIAASIVVLLLLAAFWRWNQQRTLAEAKATDALVEAVARWDTEAVKSHLRAGADPNAGMGGRIRLSSLGEIFRVLLHRQSQFQGPSVLSQAVARPEIVRALLESGADPNSSLDRSDPPLHMAVFAANTTSCALLIDHGARLEARDSQGCTPLLKALSYGMKQPVARLLFERGAGPHKQLSDGRDALMLASACGDLVSAQSCLVAGLSPAATDKIGRTALHFASLSGHADIARLLLSHRAPVNAAGRGGITALLYACANGFTDVADLLLDHGADATLCDRTGTSPMHSAVMAHQRSELLLGLLDKLRLHGADVTAMDARRMTPLHLAVPDAWPDRVDWLLKHGARADAQDNLGRTPLHVAVATVGEFSNIGCIKRLVGAHADVNARDKLGVTPLLSAVSATQRSSDRDEVVAFLLSHGASLTLADARGTTPLTFAQHLQRTQPDLARRLEGLLLKRTPKPAARGISGEAP